MDLTIEQSCPTCGAPVTLHEADRVIQCTFCDVKNFMVIQGPQRFILPDKAPDSIHREDIYYIPYLRFKGHIFSCQGREVSYKLIDTTQVGISARFFPASLGLRPQAMKVIPATANVAGQFVRLTEKTATLFSKAALLTSAFSQQGTKPLYHRAFIGETVSCIYLPTYLEEDKLYDAVLNREIGRVTDPHTFFQETIRFRRKWEPRFLSTICPHCAEALDGAHDSLILSCSNCVSLWEEKDGQFQGIDWQMVISKEANSQYLPFWKITPHVEGIPLTTFADFLRITNHPVVIREEHERMILTLWVPAFKIRPKFLLHLAKTLTLSQNKIPDGEKQMEIGMHPVTLPLSEAMQALKSVLAKSGLNKKKLLPQLPNISFHSTNNARLTYLPFNDVGHDLVQEQTGVTLANAVLRFSRSL